MAYTPPVLPQIDVRGAMSGLLQAGAKRGELPGQLLGQYQDRLLAEKIAAQDQSNKDRLYEITKATADRDDKIFKRDESDRLKQQETIKNFDGTTEKYGADYTGVNVFNDKIQALAAQNADGVVTMEQAQPLLAKLNQQDSYGFSGSEFESRGYGMTNQQVARDKLTQELTMAGMSPQSALAQATAMTGDLTNRTSISTLAAERAKDNDKILNDYNMEMFKEANKSALLSGRKGVSTTMNADGTMSFNTGITKTPYEDTAVQHKQLMDSVDNTGSLLSGHGDNKNAVEAFNKYAQKYPNVPAQAITNTLLAHTDDGVFWKTFKTDKDTDTAIDTTLKGMSTGNTVGNVTPPKLQKTKVAPLTASKDNWNSFWGGVNTDTDTDTDTATNTKNDTKDDTKNSGEKLLPNQILSMDDKEQKERQKIQDDWDKEVESKDSELNKAKSVIEDSNSTVKEVKQAEKIMDNINRGTKLKNYITRDTNGILSEDSKKQWMHIADSMSKGYDLTKNAMKFMVNNLGDIPDNIAKATFGNSQQYGDLINSRNVKRPEKYKSDVAKEIMEENSTVRNLKEYKTFEDFVTNEDGKFVDPATGDVWFFKDGKMISLNRGM